MTFILKTISIFFGSWTLSMLRLYDAVTLQNAKKEWHGGKFHKWDSLKHPLAPHRDVEVGNIELFHLILSTQLILPTLKYLNLHVWPTLWSHTEIQNKCNTTKPCMNLIRQRNRAQGDLLWFFSPNFKVSSPRMQGCECNWDLEGPDRKRWVKLGDWENGQRGGQGAYRLA
jgi:hypothetical protein